MTKTARKICKFCTQKANFIDYKNIPVLRRYIQSGGKIQPRRYSGVCSSHQRQLTSAIKKARIAALVPFVR